MSMKVCTIHYPGSAGHEEVDLLCKNAFDVKPEVIWHQEPRIPEGTDLIIIGGTTSFANVYRPGAIATLSKISGGITNFSKNGGKIIGICNGFQILCQMRLLPGSLEPNYPRGFIKKDVHIIQNSKEVFNASDKNIYKLGIIGTHLRYLCSKRELLTMNDFDQVAYKFCSKTGKISPKEFNNGSTEAICGVQNKSKNVLGVIFRPDRACDISKHGTDIGAKLLKNMFL